MSTSGTPVIFCNACGAHNATDARFCQSCGQAMSAMEPLPITTSVVAYATHPYGGFWIRLVAWLIDAIIISVVFAPFRIALGINSGMMDGTGPRQVGLPFLLVLKLLVLYTAVWWLYEAAMTSSSKQGTLGKMALSLRVTDLEGRRISFGRATGRHFAKYISAFILGIGYLMVAFSERKQGLHDMIAGTLVRKTR